MIVGNALVLNDGGLRSLVAAATAHRGQPPLMLYIHDGRPDDAHRRDRFNQQCEYFNVDQPIELHLPHLHRRTAEHASAQTPLATFQRLAAASAKAVDRQLDRLIWPVCVGEAFDKLATIAETLVLLEHAVQLQAGRRLAVETPLLELSMKQVVELGAQMDLPWRLARSCRGAAPEPCGQCPGCLNRARAFDAAGVEDPLHVSQA